MSYKLQSHFGQLRIWDDVASTGYFAGPYNNEDDIIKPMAVVNSLNMSHRPNLEQRRDGLYVCWNDHDKGVDCDYELVIKYPLEYIADHDRKDLPELSGTTKVGTASVQSTNQVITTGGPLTYKPTQTTGDAKLPIQGAIFPSINKSGKIFDLSAFQNSPFSGWVCPLCGAGNSPYKGKCDCTQKHNITC